MRNWLGQDIVPGSVVYRGARDGNHSSFKIGVVQSVNEQKNTARVSWKFAPIPRTSWVFKNVPDGKIDSLGACVIRQDSSGSPSLDTLVVMEVDLEMLGAVADRIAELRKQYLPNPYRRV